MAWETRKGSGRYYTRSRRQNGRIVREYIGSGALAEFLAQIDARIREEREMEAENAAEEQAKRDAYYARLFGPLDMLEAANAALMQETMTALGYHQHKRGEWRRPRGSQEAAR